MSSQGMHWNILDAFFAPASSYNHNFIIPNEMKTVRLCLRRFFLSSNIHFHSTLSIYGSIWLNFGMVPIHPSCANSSRPVVNFIFFNKTKTEVPEVLKMYLCRAFMHSSYAYIRYNLLAVSWFRWRRSKKGVPFAPVSPKQKLSQQQYF